MNVVSKTLISLEEQEMLMTIYIKTLHNMAKIHTT